MHLTTLLYLNNMQSWKQLWWATVSQRDTTSSNNRLKCWLCWGPPSPGHLHPSHWYCRCFSSYCFIELYSTRPLIMKTCFSYTGAGKAFSCQQYRTAQWLFIIITWWRVVYSCRNPLLRQKSPCLDRKSHSGNSFCWTYPLYKIFRAKIAIKLSVYTLCI